MIDHITFEVHADQLHTDRMDEFMDLLGFIEIDASEEVKMGYDVRWFIHRVYPGSYWQYRKPELHLVAGGDPAPLGLTHFCISGVGEDGMEECRTSDWLEHEREGSGRLWLAGPAGLRVEVRP